MKYQKGMLSHRKENQRFDIQRQCLPFFFKRTKKKQNKNNNPGNISCGSQENHFNILNILTLLEKVLLKWIRRIHINKAQLLTQLIGFPMSYVCISCKQQVVTISFSLCMAISFQKYQKLHRELLAWRESKALLISTQQ